MSEIVEKPNSIADFESLEADDLFLFIRGGNEAFEHIQDGLNYSTEPNLPELRVLYRGLAAIATLRDRWLPNPTNEPDLSNSRVSLGELLRQAVSVEDFKDIAEGYDSSSNHRFNKLSNPTPTYPEDLIEPKPAEQIKQPTIRATLSKTELSPPKAKKQKLSKEERDTKEAELLPLAKAGDTQAMEDLLKLHEPWINYQASRFRLSATYNDQHFDFDDVLQMAKIGFMKAVLAYEAKPTDGARLIGYSAWHIFGSIMGYIEDTRSTIRLPRNSRQEYEKWRKYKESFYDNEGHEPSIEELADHLEVSNERVDEYRRWFSITDGMEPLDGILGNDADIFDPIVDTNLRCAMVETIPSDLYDVEELVSKRTQSESIKKFVENTKLHDWPRQILSLRYGLNGVEPKTLEEVGDEFNLTRERIRQIEVKAIAKIRSEVYWSHQEETLRSLL